MSERLLLRAEETAELLGVGRSKVWELIWTRELPAIRIGRLVRIPRSELERWIAERTEVNAG
jgi:excisionase family DNA binding protein